MTALAFRLFEGDVDLPGMHTVSQVSLIADGMNMLEDFESFSESYSEFSEMLPAEDVIILESEDKIIGHARVWWKKYSGGRRLYSVASFVLPEYSSARRELIERAELRLADIASCHPPEVEKAFETQCVGGTPLEGLFRSMGYSLGRTFFEMVRPLGKTEEKKVPGITIRQVREDELKTAWSVAREAFRGQRMFAEENWSEERLDAKMRSPFFDITLWYVACHGDEIVGSVYNYIKPEENQMLDRRRGYISNVCVSGDFRGKGIAKALICKGLRELESRGMKEARLGVDSENPTGALDLYRSLGFAVSNSYLSFVKPMK